MSSHEHLKVGDKVRIKHVPKTAPHGDASYTDSLIGKCGVVIGLRPTTVWVEGGPTKDPIFKFTKDAELERLLPKPVLLPSELNEGVTSQAHYTQFKIQPLEFSGMNNLGFLEGNVVKYVCRYKAKNGVEDLRKARHYMECLIEREEKGTITLPTRSA